MHFTVDVPSIATNQLLSHLEQQVSVVAPDIPALVQRRISVDRIGLTNNASHTPYLVYYVGDGRSLDRLRHRRCCTFFKRRILFDLMQLLLKVEYSITERIRSISVDVFNCFSLLLSKDCKNIPNRQACQFVERCNNKAQPPEEIKIPTALVGYSMYTRSNSSAIRNERIAREYREQQRAQIVVPSTEQLLETALNSGAIASWEEHPEGGLYWICTTPSSKRELVTSCGLGNFLRKLAGIQDKYAI